MAVLYVHTVATLRGIALTGGYKCASKECNKKFTVISGTIFENTKIELKIWFAAIYLCTAHKKGISSLQLSETMYYTEGCMVRITQYS